MTTIRAKQQPKTTAGYDAYWRFASKRQEIYLRKLSGTLKDNPPDDPILAVNRFTNAYRASDRVSQFLISHVQYNQEWNWLDTFVRTLLFKIFNRIDTWNYLLEQIGEPDSNALFDRTIDAALEELANHQPIYSAAYIMPPPRSSTGPKYVRHLDLLRTMIDEEAHRQIQDTSSMEQGYNIFLRYDSIGNFLAYQFISDLNYSSYLDYSEQEFVVPGPGAIRGIRKCFLATKDLSHEDLIRWMHDHQHEEFETRQLPWDGLWGRDLQLIDIQNLFCEVDKYTRVAMPELSEFAPGTRIKQRYRPDPSPLTAWFPPKWGINENIVFAPSPEDIGIQESLFCDQEFVEEGQLTLV
ncbi:MAG: hypothetical protein KTV68_14655 [Acidimicrobiia bacterium]|nr:hypothetical protein [Acidimicrobiia bacterium]MCY4435202.1 putative DNA base hypermodification protein [bacterium]